MTTAATTNTRGLGAFFALTFAWTYGVIGVVFFGIGIAPTSVAGGLALLLAGSAPSILGVLLTWRYRGRTGLRQLWRRTIRVRLGWGWYGAILAAPFVLEGLRLLVYVLRGGEIVVGNRLGQIAAQPLTLLPFLVTMFITGPLIEEFGWRGFALDRLQARWNALGASLILGLLWGPWHLLLFFLPDGPMAQTGALALIDFLISILPLTVLYTWLHNNTATSIWAALLFHTMNRTAAELVGDLTDPEPLDRVIGVGMSVAVAAVVVRVWGAARLKRRA